MLTQDQIDEGASRLVANKLSPRDVDSWVSIFRMFFADLETVYNYQFQSKLEGLDDTTGGMQQAAQVVGALIILEEEGFSALELEGGRDAVNLKAIEEYWQYVKFAFTKLYPLPKEFATYSLARAFIVRHSQTVRTYRSEVG